MKPGRVYGITYVCLIFLLIWVIVLWWAAIYKIASDGWGEYFMHLTNWNWSAQVIFFTSEFFAVLFDTIIILFDIKNASVDSWRILNLSVLFWIVNGLSWEVFWLVFLLFHDNPLFLFKLTKDFGGKLDAWIVLEGNSIFHVLISVVMLIYIIVQKKQVDDSVGIYLRPRKYIKSKDKETDDGKKRVDYNEFDDGDLDFGTCEAFLPTTERLSTKFLFFVIFFPLGIVGLYTAIFNISAVYGLTSDFGWLVLLSLGISFVFNGIYGIYAMLYFRKYRTRTYKNAKITFMYHAIRSSFCI